jgi:hypothetical protein
MNVAVPLVQIGALEARLVSSESTVMSLQHHIQQKEADLVALRQEVSMVSLCLSMMVLDGSEWSPSYCSA